MSDERLRRDELVSAYLDGEATPAEVAEVEAGAALLDRAEQLRAVQVAVAAPIPPRSAEQRDQMVSTALAAADAEPDTRSDTTGDGGRGARVLLLRRPEILVMAAAAVLLAAVVSAGLITSRGGDEAQSEMAGAAPAAADADEAASAEMAEAPAEELTAEADAAADTAPEVTVAGAEEAMAEAEPMAELETALAEPAAEAEMAAPTDERAADVESAAADGRDQSADLAADDAAPVAEAVDLGQLASLDSLFESIGASPAAALDDTAAEDPADGTAVEAGPCSEAVHQHVLESSAETLRSFVAAVGVEDPVAVDARLALRADGGLLIVYAVDPGCEVEIHELAGP